MKKINTYLFVLVLLTSMFVSSKVCFADEVKYTINQYTIDADIERDGGVNATEYLGCSFSGKANDISWSIDYKSPNNSLYSAKGIDSIAVYEAGITDDDMTEYTLEQGGNGSAGIYSITNTDSGIKLKIYSPANNEPKRFVIQYHLKDVAVKYKDTADFYWDFIRSGFDKDLNNVSIVVTIPEEANSLRIFSHGPYSGVNTIVDPKTVQYEIKHLGAGKGVTLRVLFPAKLLTSSDKYINENKLPSILKEEAAFSKKASTDRRNTIISVILAVAWLIISIIIFIILYIVYFRNKKASR